MNIKTIASAVLAAVVLCAAPAFAARSRLGQTSQQMIHGPFPPDACEEQLIHVSPFRKKFYIFHDDRHQTPVGIILQPDKPAHGPQRIQGVLPVDLLQQNRAFPRF